ncbi:DUF637 domain-containing protein [Pseudoalteromonas luteoviolacea]|uniref:DUF637 domain-containing protein n=1 Tax=Pseudoalteromonas luteoviolacea S4054 TaxID=1129367 RepID=A0A0F6AAM1_9GAMM|nr:DUF637 domain-containing protein [Pseudoalteromonas luteoviolacea]AOT09538.1 hypothetical protein S4054249_17640 [Pseudoalteromonas luteoviolacea]AOT14450.1 hypothetical protein S40542_17610 [Pseudoalteromonas luteoviolacea]AOT19366.1 hypothetical protein S4054_17615 [Pseudoalteromonas luteoviolacea]KKE83203.1 hypothetical protein N479_15275 [Pseudoalteromonas luteoviolacea S4054]KZN68832.1 hypothetical protein N481_23085 [Pseudoalteromonas luteoviolacea S4047-1]
MSINHLYPEEKYYQKWHKLTSAFLVFLFIFQATFPSVAMAAQLISNNQIKTDLESTLQFERVNDRKYQYKKIEYVEENLNNFATIETFYNRLNNGYRRYLPSPIYLPIMTGGVAAIIPLYQVDKQVGDAYVQSRYIRSQIFSQLGQQMIDFTGGDGSSSAQLQNERAQVQKLYDNALDFAINNEKVFGEPLNGTTQSFDMIWPEYREINGERVLVPIVYLTQDTIKNNKIDSHVVKFEGRKVTWGSITSNGQDLLTGRDTILRTLNDLTNNGGHISSSGDLNLHVGGTLKNISGQLSASENVNILATNLEHKTLVHRFHHQYGNGAYLTEYLDTPATIKAHNGNIRIRTYGDIEVQGAQIVAPSGFIEMNATGDISIESIALNSSSNSSGQGYKYQQSDIEVVQSKLSAKETISLMASGAILLDAAIIGSDQGAIELVANNGIQILDAKGQHQSTKHQKFRKTTVDEQIFESFVIRSALEAGKGVKITSNFGDITLRAAKLTSTDGTQISAHNGRVNLLLATEQNNYFYNKVKKGTWKIKTRTIQNQEDIPVYNQVIGGIQVNATHGITLDLGTYEGQTISNVIDGFRDSTNLKWMASIYDDNKVACPNLSSAHHHSGIHPDIYQMMRADSDFTNCSGNLIDVVQKKLERIQVDKSTSTLSPAAMAVIAIAVSVAMGPGGMELVGTGGKIGVTSSKFLTGALQAGATSIATQAATSLASGHGIDGTIEKLVSSDNIRSLAASMVTAGIVAEIGALELFGQASPSADLISKDTLIALGNQTVDSVINTTISASVTTLMEGGDPSMIKDALMNSLSNIAIDALGKQMAEEIGRLADADTISEGLRYVSHAALGCAIGVAKADQSDSVSSNLGCSSGATGAVIGEVISDKYKSSQGYDTRKKNLDNQLKALGLTAETYKDLSFEESKAAFNQKADIDNQLKTLNQIKETGVDLGKLAAATSALIVGAEANIATSTAENAAENNAFWFVLQAAYLTLKAYDVYQTVQATGELLKEFTNAGEDRREEILFELGKTLAVEVVVGKTASEGLDLLIQKARKSNMIPETLLTEVNSYYGHFTNGTPNNYSIGASQTNSTSGINNHKIPTNKSRDIVGALNEKDAAKVSERGHINKCSINGSACEIDLETDEQHMVNDFSKNLSTMKSHERGQKLEEIVESVLTRDGNLTPIDGTYRNINGVDHLHLLKDSNGNVKAVLALDSKQNKQSGNWSDTRHGSIKLSTKGAGNNVQLTDDWFRAVAKHLKDAGKVDAANHITKALDNNTLIKGVATINPRSQKLIIVPVKSFDD